MPTKRHGARGLPSPDERDQLDLLTELERIPNFTSKEVSVQVTEHHVILRGRVPTAAQRSLAEQIANRIGHGRKVDNQLLVG